MRFLAAQCTERDGVEQRLIAGCFGIFGHGNVAGVGQALLQARAAEPGRCCRTTWPATSRPWCTPRSATPGCATGCRTLACTASIGPGATNMVTGAALATINRLPVLLLPGDIFATRVASPVLQELEDPRRLRRVASTTRSGRCRGSSTGSTGPSSCRPRCSPRCGCSPTRPRPARSRSRCRRTCRPRRTTGRRSCSPSGSGTCARPVPEPAALARAVERASRSARRPLIVAGGGVIYSEATDGAARVRRGDRHPGGRDPGRQGRAAARTTRWRSARSAPPAPPPPTRWPARPTW